MYIGKRPTRRSTKARTRPSQTVALGPFPLGLNTALGANEIADGEASILLNMQLSESGGLETRNGLVRYSTTALPNAPSAFATFPLFGQATGGFLLHTDDDISYANSYYVEDTELTSASYKWTESGSGTHEYYLEASGGGDPGIGIPEAVMMDSVQLAEGTLGSLADHEYGYGDNDSLGFNTVYVADATGDPDVSGVSIYTMASSTLGVLEQVMSYPDSTEADELVVTENDNKLYYLDGNKAPVLAGTLSGQASVLPFGNYCLLLDGGRIKYWDRSANTIQMAYDDGTGTTGYQSDNTGLTADTQIKMYSGSNTRVALKVTTQAWDSGYTITATEARFYVTLVEGGTLSGDDDIACKIYKTDGSVLTTSDTTHSTSALSADVSTPLTFTFSSGDMSPDTIYWVAIEFSDGDAANYVQVDCDTVTSNGDAYYYDGTWHADTTKKPLAYLKPGQPPRARFGIVSENRVYCSGGPDSPGYMWYCNAGDCFDWSSANGGGYVGAVDENANNFPIGAIVGKYGDIYVFGQASQPYLCKLTGSSPSDFSLPPLFQKIYATHKTAIDVINDVWLANKDGVNALSGVQEYGDIRTFKESGSVQNIILDHWDDDSTFAGYSGTTGHYLVKLPGYPRVLVAHTKSPVLNNNDGRRRYPWTEFIFIKEHLSSSAYKWTASSTLHEYYCELAASGDPSISEPAHVLFDASVATRGTVGSLEDHEWGYGDADSLGYNTIYIRDDSGPPDTTGIKIFTVLEPTCFASFGNDFFVGASDGYIYKLDISVGQDNSNRIPFAVAGKFHEIPFNDVCLERYKLLCDADASGTTMTIGFYNEKVSTDTIIDTTAAAEFDVTVDTRTDGDINWTTDKFMAVLTDIDNQNDKMRVHNLQLDTSILSK